MIKCVFFDLDGVLRDWKSEFHGVDALSGIPLSSIQDTAFSPELLSPAITGKWTDEEWRTNIAHKLSDGYPRRYAISAVREWSRGVGHVVGPVKDIVSECRSKVAVGLMTNGTSRLESDLKALELRTLFDVVVNSAEIGLAKPDTGIYQAALRLVNIRPEETFFTDDGEDNVEAARHLGWVTHHFINHQDLRRSLVEARVLT